MMALGNKLRKPVRSPKKSQTPVWAGPAGEGPQGGVTQGLLGRYLSDKERFRILTIEGLKPADKFNPRIEFGSMWHVCEEVHARGGIVSNKGGNPAWVIELERYCNELASRYPFQRHEIGHWFSLAISLFPEYAHYWAEHPDVKDRTPLFQEETFDVRYDLPSGRIVRLRGKWDSVDLISKGKGTGIYLQENKTKSTIDGEKMGRQLTFDLQTMLYLVALKYAAHPETGENVEELNGAPIKGVRYNVIRRPAHKSVESAMKKLTEDMAAGRAGEWFARWKMEIGGADLYRFRQQCLDPVLENLLDDYEWWCDVVAHEDKDEYTIWDWNVRREAFPHHITRHFRMPYGIYNPLIEGGTGDLDNYLLTGSETGLQRTDNLFPELYI